MEEELREKAIQSLVEILRESPFNVEFKVKKKPKGVRIIYEVTQEQMDEIQRKLSDGVLHEEGERG